MKRPSPYSGGRAAVSMKQVGLNVACDPLMSSAYTGVKGGFVVISADDPGPHSSQTEQDSRLMALMAKIPVLDPATPQEAKDQVAVAYRLSEEFEIPVMIRPTTRVCHARQGVVLGPFAPPPPPSGFPKNPQRWAATPRYRLTLHRQLNQKIETLSVRYGQEFFKRVLGGKKATRAVVSSGVALAHTYDLIAELGLEERIALFQVQMPYPLQAAAVFREIEPFADILIIEETAPVIEMQLGRRDRLRGRWDGSVPPRENSFPTSSKRSCENLRVWRRGRNPWRRENPGGPRYARAAPIARPFMRSARPCPRPSIPATSAVIPWASI